MSAFEKLPREIRDLIYEHCLLYKGEIIPFPRIYERVGSDRDPDAFKFRSSMDRRGPFVGYPRVKRDYWQTELKPCVALLGVNSTIREEAATVLFGKNVWRLSSMSYVQDDRYLLWKTFASYFRHIVVKFDARDVDAAMLLDITMRKDARKEEDSEGAEDSDHFDLPEAGEIDQEVNLLKDEFIARWDILQQMKLKSLSIDFSLWYCPLGCWGDHEALQVCFAWLASFGPKYRLEQVDEIKVVGLKDEKDNKLFWEALGVETN